MLMRDERANKDQESRAIRAIRARPGLAARGAQLPAKYHNGAVVLQHPELLSPHHVSRHMRSAASGALLQAGVDCSGDPAAELAAASVKLPPDAALLVALH